jgi:3-deoxy-D-manno-octulosonic-acid transferase
MFYLIYNLLSVFLLIPVVCYHLYRSVSRGRSPAFAERFGYLSENELATIGKRPVIWLHAVSVGESLAARPLLKALRSTYPDHAILVSNTTETGRGIASRFPETDLCIYFPFDFLPAVTRVLERIEPRLVIIMETEIWPNFNREASRRGIPLVLANGRISDRSYDRYLAFSWFFRHSLQFFNSLCMQTDTDRDRIVSIGAPPDRTLATGNLKYDIPYRNVPAEEVRSLRELYRIPENLTVICAGSTHPGEELHVIQAYRELLGSCNDLFLVLVPRHPERADEVAGLLQGAGIACRRRTALNNRGNDLFRSGAVLLVDTVGELMSLYALSDIVYVGGSLVPTGGHNLLEPASLGIPFVYGPHMNNFREIAALVTHYGAGVQIETAEGLVETCSSLIASTDLRRVLGQNGLKMMRDNGGATDRHMEIISRYL